MDLSDASLSFDVSAFNYMTGSVGVWCGVLYFVRGRSCPGAAVQIISHSDWFCRRHITCSGAVLGRWCKEKCRVSMAAPHRKSEWSTGVITLNAPVHPGRGSCLLWAPKKISRCGRKDDWLRSVTGAGFRHCAYTRLLKVSWLLTGNSAPCVWFTVDVLQWCYSYHL